MELDGSDERDDDDDTAPYNEAENVNEVYNGHNVEDYRDSDMITAIAISMMITTILSISKLIAVATLSMMTRLRWHA